VYRERYLSNLKREFPNVPFYKEFWPWAEWGKRLLELHLGYRTCAPFNLGRKDASEEGPPNPVLSAVPARGEIVIDSCTILSGVPSVAWEYRLGSRNAIEWVLNQHKVRKPKDQAVRDILKKT